jgi:hypothetical protein
LADLTPMRVPRPLKKSLEKKTPEMQAAIVECFRRLRTDYRHPGLHAHRVRGTKDLWEAYVDQKNRVTFFWDGPMIVVENHCSHKVVDR